MVSYLPQHPLPRRSVPGSHSLGGNTVSVLPPWEGVTWEGRFHWAYGSGMVGGPESSEPLIGWV